MIKAEYDALQDGDIVQFRGGVRRGPVTACLPDKNQIQFAYEGDNGHITLATLPYACLDFVSRHPKDVESVPRDTRTRARTRV